MTDAWSVYAEIAERDPATLSPAHRALVAICDLRQEVNADGFEGYFSAWGGNSALTAVEVLPAVLGQPWADLLRTAMTLLGPSYPTEPDDRAAVIDRLDLNSQLNALDERFYDLEAETDADHVLNNYLDTTTD